MLFYPLVYILTLFFSLLKEMDNSGSSVGASDAIRDARAKVQEFKDAVADTPTTTSNTKSSDDELL